MLLLEDRRFYVYVYLDPRKKGNYTYDNYHFDYEPFYVGEGKKERLKSHLFESNNKDVHSYKVHKIRKIWKIGLNPIIVKLHSDLTKKEGLVIESYLTHLIGIYLEKGILTNIEHGGKCKGSHTCILNKRKSNIRKGKKYTEIFKNPEEWLNNISKKRQGESNAMYGKHHSLKTCKQIGSDRKEKGLAKGRNNPKYRKIDYKFLILEYFNICSRTNILINYNNSHKEDKLFLSRYDRFLKILNFPVNATSKFCNNNAVEIYLKFVEENKDKIDWYIGNYERLEDNFYGLNNITN